METIPTLHQVVERLPLTLVVTMLLLVVLPLVARLLLSSSRRNPNGGSVAIAAVPSVPPTILRNRSSGFSLSTGTALK